MTVRRLEYPSSLNCCTAVHYLTVFFSSGLCYVHTGFKTTCASNLRVELALAANIVLLGRVVS